MTANKNKLQATLGATCAALSLLGASFQAQAAATIVINNINLAGVGFNDATPATPVGGNTGTTLGEQRLIAFTHAANIWGATLTSSQPIVINAQFSALACTATTATLGSAGATSIFRNFANAPKADTWYSYALANKLAGSYLGTLNAAQINANFNSNLGQANCLAGSSFYLGLDGNHGANIDFVATLLHEMGHGVGFQTFTNGSTGLQNGGYPSVWDHYLMGTVTGKLWKDMTTAERQASALSVDKLVWTGPLVTAAIPQVLRMGAPGLTITGSQAGVTTGLHAVGEASFGAPLTSTAVAGTLMPITTSTGALDLACNPLTGAQALAAKGNVALVSRGTCGFTIKVKNLQDAGAKAVLIADNAAGAPAGMSGTDASITIPSVRISQADGVALLSALAKRTRNSSGVFASLGVTGSQYSGADPLGRMMMFAPNPYQSGSSVSHFDVTAFRNQLMEPSINGDLTHSVLVPLDLTFKLLQDIGW
ncbi:peptidase [Paucibacter sp. KBW04]|uniref:PA domain-containing protein n=1 Tax=Paucibacter sp. KBW04 TaxID=2153361 RepID=UPI000F566B26|nr:PA domain-containing protein [Paucibacter sp. KBW04]RQO60418.1 peptidase [Paucibacter sp. KBW04]